MIDNIIILISLVIIAAVVYRRVSDPKTRLRVVGEPADGKQRTLEISGLFVYPIKGCAGTSVDTATLSATGLNGDREWLLVKAERNVPSEKVLDGHQFLSQRQLPRICLLTPRLDYVSNVMIVSAPEMEDLRVPMPSNQEDGQFKPLDKVVVWDDVIPCLVYTDKRVHEWFSRFLGVEVWLCVKSPNAHWRPISAKYNSSQPDSGINIGFDDGFPAHITTESSLTKLNQIIAKDSKGSSPAVEMRNFRPNIVIRGAEPFEEDCWKSLKVLPARAAPRDETKEESDCVVLDIVKPCDRCIGPTVNQETSKHHPRAEPTRTLRQYRGVGDKWFFGENAIHRRQGDVLRVGDRVQIAATRTQAEARARLLGVAASAD